MTGNSSRPADWRTDGSGSHIRPGSHSSSQAHNCSVTFDFTDHALAFHTLVNHSRLGQSSVHSVFFNTRCTQFKVSPISFHIKTACWKYCSILLWCPLFLHSIFHLHFGGSLISFHFQFFSVTLYQHPICQRARKSHYAYTCVKNRPFILIVVVNTNQWSYWSYFLFLYKVIILFRR